MYMVHVNENFSFCRESYAHVLYAMHVRMHEGDWFLYRSPFFKGEIFLGTNVNWIWFYGDARSMDFYFFGSCQYGLELGFFFVDAKCALDF